MKKEIRSLIFLYLIFVVIKIILSYFIPASRTLADDYNYLKMSESFFYHFNLKVHGYFSGQFYPLYPIIISISHIFTNNDLVYLGIKIINSILSSLIIFPAYFLSKEFLNEKKSLLTAISISLLPSNFALISSIMAENLFYSLFLTAVYFIYKVFKNRTTKNYLLAISFSLLALLTRIHGLILIFLMFILFITGLKDKLNLKHILLIILTLIPLSIWVYYFNDVAINSYISRYLSLIKIKFWLAFIIKYISYFGYLLLGSIFLMLFFLISFKIKNKNLILFRKISIITILTSLFLAAIHALGSPRYFYGINNITLVSGRILGRYVDFALPLIFISGFTGLNYYFENKDKINNKLLKNSAIILSVIMLFTTSIILSPLVPFNNISLTLLGLVKYFIDFIIYSNVSFDFGSKSIPFLVLSLIFILTPWINYYILRKFNYRKFISLLLVFLIINSLISIGVVYYAAKTSWYYNSEQRQLALYLNKIDPQRSIVLIDKRDRGDLGGESYDKKALYVDAEKSKYTILGYWLNDELIIGDINETYADFIISTHELDLPRLYKTGNGIYLYKNEK